MILSHKGLVAYGKEHIQINHLWELASFRFSDGQIWSILKRTDSEGNEFYGHWFNVPGTRTWLFGVGEDTQGLIYSGWYELDWQGQKKWYHFDNNGEMQRGFIEDNGKI